METSTVTSEALRNVVCGVMITHHRPAECSNSVSGATCSVIHGYVAVSSIVDFGETKKVPIGKK